jgi:hypothetical protein
MVNVEGRGLNEGMSGLSPVETEEEHGKFSESSKCPVCGSNLILSEYECTVLPPH